MEDWGEGTWGGVGSFHSQSNSDNDQFSVIYNNSCIVNRWKQNVLYRFGEVSTISKEFVIFFALVIILRMTSSTS